MIKNSTYSTETTRLKKLYNDVIAEDLKKSLNLSNINQVPRLQKIVINAGLGKAKDDKKIIETAVNTIRKISGQQPIETIAKKSIASFKLREGNKVGLKVTLRDKRMYEFLDRFIGLVLPRFRDFHGVNSNSFDKSGNFSIGLIDQSVFPELTFEETTSAHGIQITFSIKSKSREHSKMLLEKFGMPFEKVAPAKEEK